MDNKFTDEQLDLIAKKLVKDFGLENEKLDEIADSPKLFWNLKREIKLQKSEQNKGWMEIWYRPILLFSAFAILAIGFGTGFIRLMNLPETETIAKIETPFIETPKIAEPQINSPKIADKAEKTLNRADKPAASAPRKIIVKVVENIAATQKSAPKIVFAKQVKTASKQTPKTVEITSSNEEVKTEFISLSYLPAPESGQIVRIKVPRAMMVSLGVSNNVSKNDELVSAEVILGDDGSSRAIRFISTDKK